MGSVFSFGGQQEFSASAFSGFGPQHDASGSGLDSLAQQADFVSLIGSFGLEQQDDIASLFIT